MDVLCNLPNLKVITLNGNSIKQIPAQIKHLNKLETLHLENNELTSLPESLLDLPNLSTVNISGNPFPKNYIKQWREKYAPAFVIKY
jgi:Leucine-rich repeat (LRR) protein